MLDQMCVSQGGADCRLEYDQQGTDVASSTKQLNSDGFVQLPSVATSVVVIFNIPSPWNDKNTRLNMTWDVRASCLETREHLAFGSDSSLSLSLSIYLTHSVRP